MAAMAAAGGGGKVTLSGEDIVDNDSGSAQVHIIFRADGTVDKKEGATTTQIDTGTDWVIPNVAANATYDVRFVGLTGDAFTAEAASVNTWIDLGSDRTWSLEKSIPGGYDNSVTFEIRGGGGTTLDTAVYTFTLVVSS